MGDSKNIKFIILNELTGVTAASGATAVISAVKTKIGTLGLSSNDLPVVYIESPVNKIYLNDHLYGYSEADENRLISTMAAIVSDWSVNDKKFSAAQNGAIVLSPEDLSIGTTAAASLSGVTGLTGSSDVNDALVGLYNYINAIGAEMGSAQTVNNIAATAAAAWNEAQLHSQVTAGTGITVSVTAKTTSTPAIYTVSVDNTIATTDFVNTAAASAAVSAATSAYTQAITDLTGVSGAGSTALTIYGAREYAESLVGALSDQLTGTDEETLALLNRIKEEILNPSSPDGMTSAVYTFLDKLMTVGAGFNGIDGGTGGATGTIKEYIDSGLNGLSSAIGGVQVLAGKGIQNINGLTGITVTLPASGITIGTYNSITGNVLATDTVNNAISKVENRAIEGISAAAVAQAGANAAATAAAGAQSTANLADAKGTTALGLLQWIIV